MYTAPPPAADDPAAEDEPPGAEPVDEPDDGALGYTSYCVAGYTTPRI
jgi:hypothetical protein